MLFENLPTELLLEILTILDYKSLAALAQTSRHFHEYASDNIIWRALYSRSFSRTRHVPCKKEWRNDYANRIASLRELIIRGTNDYQARTVRSIFSEMDVENGKLLADMIEASYVSLRDILVEGQGYALANAQRLIPGWSISGISSFFRRNHDRLHMDPRSEVHLIRMLLARHTGFQMGVTNVETFLKCAHLITYNSVDHPLYFFPPTIYDSTSAPNKERYNLRSAVPKHVITESGSGPVINWGVVETIHSLIKLYRDRMGEAIPRFVKSDDDYESEVPMVPAMFDADLAGNWKGLYGYLDFRELEVLDSTRAFTPDFFDGLQTLKIGHEEDYDLLSHPLDHGEMVERHLDQEQATELEGGSEFEMYLSDDDQQETITVEDTEEATSQRKYRFVADGTSLHGHFHIHGSTIHIPGMEAGFKIVHFDAMYNQDGLMPWIMEGIHVPSIGIVGRWRDRTEAPGEGVEGPYVLWRSRDADLRDQDESIRETNKRRLSVLEESSPKTAKVRHLTRASRDLPYIIIEELQKVAINIG